MPPSAQPVSGVSSSGIIPNADSESEIEDGYMNLIDVVCSDEEISVGIQMLEAVSQVHSHQKGEPYIIFSNRHSS